MPMGRYDLLDKVGAVRGSEDFRCAPGPIGWRCFSTVVFDDRVARVDLSVDAAWHPVRVRIENPEHHLIVASSGGRASVLLDDERSELPGAPVALYPSPAFLVAAARALGSAGGSGGGDVDAIAIDPVTLAPSVARLSFEQVAQAEDVETPCGTFTAERWRTGGREFWVAGDIVVAAPGLRLASYDRGGAGPTPH